ncbi:YciI family protein [Longimicrobium sp.]|uniref:YciI family protein n=1 Tax=Longimicrobium sp. TaxID=2029185 RepID=UPI002E30C8DD|nr:YciI family protein [Longimicrobium sp.]HEX6037295.1 YciI family protein [Longimicrobium sp.]
MKYLLMMNVKNASGDYEHLQWAPEDWQAHLDYWNRLNRGLMEAGEYVEVRALTPPAQARVVRAGQDGAPVVTDGPFPETKEFLAGFWIVDVESADRAFRIAAEASLVPGPGGAPMYMPIEVRQVMSAPPTDA